MAHRLTALRRLSPRQWLLVIESMMLLMLAAAVIAFLPFLSVARLASGRVHRPVAADRRRIVELGRIIEAVARRLPFRAKCFESGLAAQWMLRRRGIASTLFYGAALKPAGALSAHVWVRAGEVDVVGCSNASDFAVLACFPEDQAAAPSSGSKRPPRIR